MSERQRRSIKVDGFFDIETERWSIFLCGGLVRATGEVIAYDYRREYDFIKELLRRPAVLWTWNGGRYDILFAANWFLRLGLKVELYMAGARIVCAKLPEFGVEMRDAACLVPAMKLKKAAELVGIDKLETGIACVCGKRCGGYCGFFRGMPEVLLRRVIEYMLGDCEIGLEVMKKIVELAELFDLDLRGTIGASAWATARRWSDLPDAKWENRSHYEFCRMGYFGGRINVFRPWAGEGYRYDINAAYPAALSHLDLPTGPFHLVSGRDARALFGAGREGVYQAEVSVARGTFVPPLPVRGESRITYPTGRFVGAWTRIELQNALDAGARVHEFGQAIVWQEKAPLLRAAARRIWQLRAQAIADHPKKGKKAALAIWLKWFANSLTGKFAQRPETSRVLVNPKPEQLRICPADFHCMGGQLHALRRCCQHRCTGACRASVPLDVLAGPYSRIWSTPMYRIPECGHVEWSAYLTAATRIEVFQQLRADGHEGAESVYCHTDSCWSRVPRTRRVGKELGMWDFEGRFGEFFSLAPAVYVWKDEDGIWRGRAKGIPGLVDDSGRLVSEIWEALRTGQRVNLDRGVKTFRSAAALGNLFLQKDSYRVIEQGTYGDRELQGDVTLPPEVASGGA